MGSQDQHKHFRLSNMKVPCPNLALLTQQISRWCLAPHILTSLQVTPHEGSPLQLPLLRGTVAPALSDRVWEQPGTGILQQGLRDDKLAPPRVEPWPAPPRTPTAPQVACWAGPGNKVREAELRLASRQPGTLESPPWVRVHG